jgi:hypothetical protein
MFGKWYRVLVGAVSKVVTFPVHPQTHFPSIARIIVSNMKTHPSRETQRERDVDQKGSHLSETNKYPQCTVVLHKAEGGTMCSVVGIQIYRSRAHMYRAIHDQSGIAILSKRWLRLRIHPSPGSFDHEKEGHVTGHRDCMPNSREKTEKGLQKKEAGTSVSLHPPMHLSLPEITYRRGLVSYLISLLPNPPLPGS